MKILLKNGLVFFDFLLSRTDILVIDGKIAEIGENIISSADKIIDCGGKAVIPGLFDMHVHFREPGQTHKEDILSGARAAAAGGVTGVLCMPNTVPAVDSPDILREIFSKARNAPIKIYQSCAITKGLKGETLCDFSALKKVGAAAVSDDGRPVESEKMMREAVLKAAEMKIPIISHCEDLRIIDGGIINDGEISRILNVKGMKRESENSITEREIRLAKETGAAVHIAHVSTKEAVRMIEKAKKSGVSVTCETAPHYFTLTDKLLLNKDADFRMNPPLREAEDVEEIIRGLREGIIDAIITDHAPHSAEEKRDFLTAPNGVIGLETSLAVTLTELYHKRGFPLSKIIELMCVNSRKIPGIPGGNIEAGSPADLAIVDLNEEWTVKPEKMLSRSKNTPFKGMTLKGKVKYTLVDGNIVYEERK